MRKLLLLLPLLLVLSPMAEALHAHGDTHESPCPAACLGAPCGACAEIAASRLAAPETGERPAACRLVNDFVQQPLEEEIFHPPAA